MKLNTYIQNIKHFENNNLQSLSGDTFDYIYASAKTHEKCVQEAKFSFSFSP